jgi:DNA phosphorothioation-dependent restriction protein DptH
LYVHMFRRGVQERITHAIIFDEAHRASRLKLLPTMAKECRKYGIAFVVASQEARDFDTSLYAAVANYLALRLAEHDAKTLSRQIAPSSNAQRATTDRLKLMAKYQALFFGEGRQRPVQIALTK